MKSVRYLLTVAIVVLLIPAIAQAAAPKKKTAAKKPAKSTHSSSAIFITNDSSFVEMQGLVMAVPSPIYNYIDPREFTIDTSGLSSPGNVNGDHQINTADLQALLNSLKSGDGATPVTETTTKSDVNSDTSYYPADIQKLVQDLKPGYGSSETVPEPSTLVLSTVGLLSLAGYRLVRRKPAA